MTYSPLIGVLTAQSRDSAMTRLAAGLPSGFRLKHITVQDFTSLVNREHAQHPPLTSRQKLTLWPVNGIIVSQQVSRTEYESLSGPAPSLPLIDETAIARPEQRQQFLESVAVRAEFDALCDGELTANRLMQFHTCYKYQLLAHSQPLYRQSGPLVAGMSDWPSLEAFALAYRSKLMEILSCPATRENHTNVLMHIQGYFRPHLSGQQRQTLAALIDNYRRGELPLSAPVAELKRYLSLYPHSWLSSQRYLFPRLPSVAEISLQTEDL